MCGIAFAHDFNGNPVNNGVLNVFDRQRNRGTQGFGLYDGLKGNIVKATTEDKILKWLCKYDSHLIMFHHRYPTSTENTKSTAHPFATKDYFGKSQYILVHNGHITNSLGLKAKHTKLGIGYQSVLPNGKFNDSEALLWDLALYLEGKQDKLEAVGAMAFVAIKLADGQPDKLYFGRNTNPLNMILAKQGILLSSQGDGIAITSQQLYTWDYATSKLSQTYLKMPSWYEYENDNRHIIPYRDDYYQQPEWEREMDELNALDEQADDDWETAEVEELVMKYLIANQGNFELAYDQMEFDYQFIAEEMLTSEQNIQAQLFESAMRYLETDEEWLNEQSISKAYLEWRADQLDKRQLRLTEGV